MTYARIIRSGTFLFFCWLLSVAHADIKNPATLERAPVPQPDAVSANRGELIIITLNALTASSKEVQFILREAPRAGKLLDEAPVRKTKTSATLRYQSDPNSKALNDTIKFACRVEGGAVSTSETIQIRIRDLLPVIEVPEKLAMGPVRCGQQGALIVTLKNVGNADYHQPLVLPYGWTRGGSDKVFVPAGATVEENIFFNPTTTGPTEAILSFGTGPKAQVVITATGLPPVDIPSVIQLAWDPATADRRASVPVKNPLNRPVTLKFSGDDPRVIFPSEITLEPLADATIPFQLKALPSATFNGIVTLSTLGVNQPLRIGADPAPPLLLLRGLNDAQELDFGTVAASATAETKKELILENVGGRSVSLFGHSAQQFVLQGFDSGMNLAPGMTAKFIVSLKPEAIGKLRETITWIWEEKTLRFTLKTEVLRDPTDNAHVPTAPTNTAAHYVDPLESDEPGAVERQMTMGRSGLLAKDFQIDRRLPVIQDIRQIQQTDSSITLAWATLGKHQDHVILEKQIFQAEGYPRVVWLPIKDISFGTASNGATPETTAVISKLRPGHIYAVRISIKGSDGKYSQPSDPVHISIPAEPPVSWTKYFILAGFIALFFLWRWWQKRNAPLPRIYRPRIDGETAV
jgi:hypothetical protein